METLLEAGKDSDAINILKNNPRVRLWRDETNRNLNLLHYAGWHNNASFIEFVFSDEQNTVGISHWVTIFCINPCNRNLIFLKISIRQ